MTFASLPNEIFMMMANCLEIEDLQSLRLVSKAHSQMATKSLFSSLTFRSTEFSQDCIDELLTHFPTHVQSIYIQTCWNPDIDYSDRSDEDEDEDGDISDEFLDTLRTIGRFPSLKHVCIHFSKQVRTDRGEHWEAVVREDEHIRLEVFEALVSGLNNADYPVSLKRLGILNWHASEFEVICEDKFQGLLPGLEALDVRLVTEKGLRFDAEETNLFPENHKFFASFPEIWLKPLTNIKELTLSVDLFWGYWPRCDLSGLKFPQLESLTLVNWTITHEWQVEWICSHKELRRLTFDNCPIINRRVVTGLLVDGYMIATGDGNEANEILQAEIITNINWAGVFSKLVDGIPRLKELNFLNEGDSAEYLNEGKYMGKFDMNPDRYREFDITWGRIFSIWPQSQELEDDGLQEKSQDRQAWEDVQRMLRER